MKDLRHLLRSFRVLSCKDWNIYSLSVNNFSSKTDRFIRIRTNNEEKHILLQLGTSTFGKLNGTEEFFRMSIISSEQSEIDTSGEWVRKLAEIPENEISDDEDYEDYEDYGGYVGFDYYDYDDDGYNGIRFDEYLRDHFYGYRS
uniref:FTH domain-containing protein n=1 Tax=Caenorhabditis tropicalis TaxID=1561998 RepID=A0A1I7TGQ6_9PELO